VELARAVDQLPTAIAVVDAEGRLVRANALARALLGLGGELDRLPPTPMAEGPLLRTLRTGEPLEEELDLERPDGTVVALAVRTAPIRDADGRIEGAVSVFDDVAERRRARESERLLAAIVSTSQDAIFAKSLEGEIRSWNRGAQAMYGYTPDEAIGRSVTMLAPPERADEIPALLERLARGERIAPFETVRVTKDGRRLCILLTISPIADEDGTIVAASTVARDITEARRVEREHQRLEEELRHAQRLESVGRLAGGIAHEFNNILQIIRGFSTRLLARAPDDATREELHAIDEAAGRAAALVRQLLAFGGRQVLHPRPLDLNLLIEDHEPLLRAMLGAGIELHCRLELHLPQIEADPAQIEQVLTNLALNAREAMPEGGSLTIETAAVTLDGDGARPLALDPGDYVLLRVCDTGVGMDEATRERIFEPFFSTRARTDASGLGLATVHGIVAQSGGAISVESEPGAGATFTIFLPRLQTRSVAVAPSADDRRRGPGALLLVVEDEPLLLELMAVNLRDAGYRLCTAGTPHQALELVREQEFDLIVSDVVMPGMNGPEMVERIRELQPHIPALYVSGYAEQAISRGGRLEPLLAKPFKADDLLAAVAALLRSAGANEARA
jgi:PAS domain S-box-containing protein